MNLVVVADNEGNIGFKKSSLKNVADISMLGIKAILSRQVHYACVNSDVNRVKYRADGVVDDIKTNQIEKIPEPFWHFFNDNRYFAIHLNVSNLNESFMKIPIGGKSKGFEMLNFRAIAKSMLPNVKKEYYKWSMDNESIGSLDSFSEFNNRYYRMKGVLEKKYSGSQLMTKGEILTYVLLYFLSDIDGNIYMTKFKDVASMAGLSKRTVIRSLEMLSMLGYISNYTYVFPGYGDIGSFCCTLPLYSNMHAGYDKGGTGYVPMDFSLFKELTCMNIDELRIALSTTRDVYSKEIHLLKGKNKYLKGHIKAPHSMRTNSLEKRYRRGMKKKTLLSCLERIKDVLDMELIGNRLNVSLKPQFRLSSISAGYDSVCMDEMIDCIDRVKNVIEKALWYCVDNDPSSRRICLSSSNSFDGSYGKIFEEFVSCKDSYSHSENFVSDVKRAAYSFLNISNDDLNQIAMLSRNYGVYPVVNALKNMLLQDIKTKLHNEVGKVKKKATISNVVAYIKKILDNNLLTSMNVVGSYSL